MTQMQDQRDSVKIPKAAELVARKIKRRIINHELEEGDLLPPEPRLMEEFGVSRPTIREAYRILEAERLVSVTRGARGGAVVHRPDPSLITSHMMLSLSWERYTVADVYDARITFEPAVVYRVAEVAADRAPGVLQPLLDEMMARTGDVEAFSPAISDFHRQLLHLADNHLLLMMGQAIHLIFTRHQGMAMSLALHSKGTAESNLRIQAYLDAYQTLVDLTAAGKAEEAEVHWRRHIAYARKTWVRDYDMSLSELFSEYV